MASDNIHVLIRLRPLIKRELNDGSKILWQTKDKQIVQKDGNYSFQFDRVYSQQHSTIEVYEHLQPLISSVMAGINGTVFAYGQTASGKTFTMTGNDMHPGVIPLAIEEIFGTIEESPGREFLIRVSYMEIYNENVVDLLGDVRKHLEVRESMDSKIFVENLNEEIVTSPGQIYELMNSGESNRHYGSTSMNERSSRSHTIFKLIVESKERLENPEMSVRVSALNLVDLAGSEKAKQTGATGQRLAEGGFINKSLLSLTSVISQLSENAGFISYRDSKLTRILQNSLGGNSKTAIICNCTPAAMDETLSTLRFANRAKRIKNKPEVNEVLSDEALLKKYKRQINNLQKTLDNMKKTDIGNVQEEKMELQLRLKEEQLMREEQEDKINRLTELICISNKVKGSGQTPKVLDKRKRRETWCPGKARKSMAPWAQGSILQPMGTPKGFSSVNRPTYFKAPVVSPSVLSRRACSEGHFLPVNPETNKNNSFAREVFGNQVISEEGEEVSDESCDDFIKKRVDFDLSCMPSHSPFVCEVECQTEVLDTDADTKEMMFKLEFISCELETKNQRITELQAEIDNKDSELVTLNTKTEEALEKSLKEEEMLRSEIWELKKSIQSIESVHEGPGNSSFEGKSDSTMQELQKRIEALMQEKSGLETELAGLCNNVQQLIEDLDMSNKARIAAEKELEKQGHELVHLKMEIETLEEKFEAQELQELDEFTKLETDYKNMSILEKQEAKRRLSSRYSLSSPAKLSISWNADRQMEDLKKEISHLTKDRADAESMFLETKKELATSKDETKLLEQELREMKKTLTKHENEKQDFDLLIDMEIKKSKRRECELTEQLKSAYAELGHEAPVENHQVEELEAELEKLKEKLTCVEKEITSYQEEKVSILQENEKALEEKKAILREKEVLCQDKGVLSLEKDTLEQENKVLADKNNSLTQELNILGREKEVMEEENNLLKEERDELKQDKDIFLHENDVLQQEKDTVEKEKEDLLQKVYILEEKFEQLNQELNALMQDKEILAKERDSLLEEQHSLQESFRTNIENEQDCNSQNQKLAILMQENESLTSENKTLQKETESFSKEQKDLAGKMESLVKEISELTEERDGLKQEKGALAETLADLNRQNAKSGISTSSDEPKSLFDELDDLTVGLTGMFPQKSLMLNQSSSISGGGLQSELEQGAFKELQEDLEYQIAELKKEVSMLKEKEECLISEKALITEEKMTLEFKVDNLNSELTELRDDIKQLRENSSNDHGTNSVSDEIQESEKNVIKNTSTGGNEDDEKVKAEKECLTNTSTGGNEDDEKVKAEKECLRNMMKSLEAEKFFLKEENQKLKETIVLLESKIQSGTDSENSEVLLSENLKLKKSFEEVNLEKEQLLTEISQIQFQSADELEKSLETINELKQQINEYNVKISEVNAKIEGLKEEKIAIISEHVDESNDFINQLKRSKEENLALVEKHSFEVKDLQYQILELREEVNALKKQSDSKQEELQSMIYSLEDEVKEKSSVIEEGKVFLCKFQDEVETLKLKLDESETAMKENSNKLSVIENENSLLRLSNENLQDEFEHMKARLSDSYSVSDQIEKLKGQIVELREEKETVLCCKKTVEEELEKIKTDFVQTEASLTEKSDNLIEYRQKVELLENTIAKGHEMLQQYEQDIGELQEEFDKATEVKEDLEQKYEALLDKYETHFEELKNEHESEAQGYIDKIEELQKVHDLACTDYEEQLKVIMDSRNEELKQHHSEQIERMKQELEDVKTSHSKVEAKLSAELVEREHILEGEIKTLKQTLQNTEVEMCNKALELECKLDEQNKASEHHVQNLQNEKDILQGQIEELKTLIEDFNKEKQRDTDSIKEHESELAELRKKLEQEKAWFEEEEQRLMKCCDDADSELADFTTKYNKLEAEFDDYKKKMLENTTQSFENAEGMYQKKFDLLKQQYEQEILRLTSKKDEVYNDLDQSVCQLKDEKSKIADLQATYRRLESDNDKLKASLQNANTRIQQLQKDLNFKIEYFKDETDHLRSCVDSAEYDLDRKNSEYLYLKQDVENLKKQLADSGNADQVKTLEEEKESIARQLAEQKMKIVMMSTQLMKSEDPYKKEIKYLKDENNHAKEQVQKLKNEVRRLKNNQPDDSVLFDSSKSGVNHMAGSGVVNEVLRFTLEAEKHKLERDLKSAQEEVQRLKKHYDSHKLMITELKTQLTDRDDKIFRYKKYYRKQLNSDEREALKDVINSPKPLEKSRKIMSESITSFHGENKAPVNTNAANNGNEVNYLNMSTWLTKDTKKEEGPSDCKTQ